MNRIIKFCAASMDLDESKFSSSTYYSLTAMLSFIFAVDFILLAAYVVCLFPLAYYNKVVSERVQTVDHVLLAFHCLLVGYVIQSKPVKKEEK